MGECLGESAGLQALGEGGGVLQGEVDALTELRAHGVGGVAEDDDVFAVAGGKADIAVTSGEDLGPVVDLGEKGFCPWSDGEDGVFPSLQRLGANGLVVGELAAPEEAHEIVVVIELASGGEEASQLAGAVDDLVEFAGGEGVVVFANEPVSAPRVTAIDAFGEELLPKTRAGSVGDDEEVEGLTLFTSGGVENPALAVVLGGGDFPVPMDGDTFLCHCGEEVMEENRAMEPKPELVVRELLILEVEEVLPLLIEDVEALDTGSAIQDGVEDAEFGQDGHAGGL